MGGRLPTWGLLKCIDCVWPFKNWGPIVHTVAPFVAFAVQSAIGIGRWHFSRVRGQRGRRAPGWERMAWGAAGSVQQEPAPRWR